MNRPRVPGIKAAPVEITPTVEPETGLPNAIDIDAKTIEAPVLTRQGWVVPDEEHRKQLKALQAAKDKLGIA